ncbi:MAG: signal peptidase I [Clostridia bacterium]|nr:signal peptidase I [Clostridia bacterium]
MNRDEEFYNGDNNGDNNGEENVYYENAECAYDVNAEGYYEDGQNGYSAEEQNIYYDENGNPYYAAQEENVTDAGAYETIPDESAADGDVTVSKKKKEKKKRTKKEIIKDVIVFAVLIIIAFFAAVLVNIYVIRKSNVVGDSMWPTYYHGDSVAISRLPVMFGDLEFGDVIVFDSTLQERTLAVDFSETLKDNVLTQSFYSDEELYDMKHRFYIKRVIGVAGDTISVENGILYLNGEVLENTGFEVIEPTNYYSAYEGSTWVVEEDHVFVLGDNRGNSKDSREIGCVPVECVLGKVVFE